MLRLDGSWMGSALNSGSRQLKQWNWVATLDISLTRALSEIRGNLSTNLEAKEWVRNYFINQRGYSPAADVSED